MSLTVQQNIDHIQTTHIGSLPRPHHLLDAMKVKYSGQPYDETFFQEALRGAVTDRPRTGRLRHRNRCPLRWRSFCRWRALIAEKLRGDSDCVIRGCRHRDLRGCPRGWSINDPSHRFIETRALSAKAVGHMRRVFVAEGNPADNLTISADREMVADELRMGGERRLRD
jgi:hypothetical protein